MQVGLARKPRPSWMADFFAAVRNSALLCRPLENTLSPYELKYYTFDPKAPERALHPPDVAFRLDAKVLAKLKEKVERSRKNVQGVLISLSLDSPIDSLLELADKDQQDVGALQESEKGFCVGFAVVKDENTTDIQQRVKEELRRCSERSGAFYNGGGERGTGRLTEVARLMVRVLRVFLLVEQGAGGLQVGRMLFFPKASFPLRKVKLTPATFAGNDVQKHIARGLDFHRELNYGYLTLTKNEKGFKLVLLDKNEPELHQNSVPVIGVWIAGNFGNSLQRDAAFWSLIVEYLTNPLITKRLSLVGERSGLLIAFDQPTKNTHYLFEYPNNSKWALSAHIDTLQRLPEEYSFSQQRESIPEEEKEESEVESISSKDRQKVVFDGKDGADLTSNRSLDEKDHEIKSLKIQLELYKDRCQKLEQFIANLTAPQPNRHFPPPYMPYPQPYPVFPMSYPEPPTPDPPYFGKKSTDLQVEYECAPQKNKLFTAKDLKNISFAQENGGQEEHNSSNFLDDQRFNSPQFKQEITKKEFTQVAEPDFEEEQDEKVMPVPVPTNPLPVRRTPSNTDKEKMERDKIIREKAERQRTERQRAQRQRVEKAEREREKELQRERERIMRQKEREEAETKYSKVISTMESKYSSYQPVTREKSPTVKTLQERRQPLYKASPTQREPERQRPTDIEEPRERARRPTTPLSKSPDLRQSDKKEQMSSPRHKEQSSPQGINVPRAKANVASDSDDDEYTKEIIHRYRQKKK